MPIWKTAKILLKLFKKLMALEVTFSFIQDLEFFLSMESLTILKPGKLHWHPFGNLEACLKIPSKTMKGLKSIILEVGQRELNSLRDNMMMPKEVSTSIAVQMIPSPLPKKIFTYTLQMNWKWMLKIFGSTICLTCKFLP